MYQDKRDRLDMSIARRACQSKTLCGRSVPDWQPSCERLPPAGWAVVALGVGMMALCCAVVSCVEFRYSGPSINSAAVFVSRKQYGNHISATTQLSQYCRHWVFQLSESSDFKGAIADNLYHTLSPTQVDHYYYYTSIYSFYHGALEQ